MSVKLFQSADKEGLVNKGVVRVHVDVAVDESWQNFA